jgi:hypothetical protein
MRYSIPIHQTALQPPPAIQVPLPPPVTTPNDVRKYLLDNKWRVSTNNNGDEFYTHDDSPQWFTWNEALAYHAFKRVTLGALSRGENGQTV